MKNDDTYKAAGGRARTGGVGYSKENNEILMNSGCKTGRWGEGGEINSSKRLLEKKNV